MLQTLVGDCAEQKTEALQHVRNSPFRTVSWCVAVHCKRPETRYCCRVHCSSCGNAVGLNIEPINQIQSARSMQFKLSFCWRARGGASCGGMREVHIVMPCYMARLRGCACHHIVAPPM